MGQMILKVSSNLSDSRVRVSPTHTCPPHTASPHLLLCTARMCCPQPKALLGLWSSGGGLRVSQRPREASPSPAKLSRPLQTNTVPTGLSCSQPEMGKNGGDCCQLFSSHFSQPICGTAEAGYRRLYPVIFSLYVPAPFTFIPYVSLLAQPKEGKRKEEGSGLLETYSQMLAFSSKRPQNGGFLRPVLTS